MSFLGLVACGGAAESGASENPAEPPPDRSDPPPARDEAAAQQEFQQGKSLFDSGRIEDAQDHLLRAVAFDPENLAALTLLGRSCVVRSQRFAPSQGAEAFQQALDLDPTHAEAWWGIGYAAFLTSDHTQALAAFERLFALDSPAIHPHQLGEAHHFYATILVFNGEYDAAIEHLEESRRLYPEFAESAYQLGIAWEKKGQLAEAQQAFEQSLRLDPYHMPSHFRLAKVYGRQGMVDKQQRHAKIHSLINALTDNTSAPTESDLRERERRLAELIAVQPENHRARLEHAQLVRRSNPSTASLLLDALVEEQTKVPEVYLFRAEISVSFGDNSTAREVLRKFREQMPDFPLNAIPPRLRALLNP